MYRGKIEFIDSNKNIHVSMNDFFADNFSNKEAYPIATISYPLYGSDFKGFFEQLFVGTNVWCLLEKNDKRKPIIVGIIKESQDFPDMNTNTLLKIHNKYNGIEIKYNDKDNIELIIDGDINISLKNGNHKNLLTQLNDITDVINEIKNNIGNLNTKYNTHTHISASSGSLTSQPTPTSILNWVKTQFNKIFQKK